MRPFLILLWLISVASNDENAQTNGTNSAIIRSPTRNELLTALDHALEKCPNLYFCTRNQSHIGGSTVETRNTDLDSPLLYPCCFQCRCEDDCIIYNSCCPDAPVLVNQPQQEGSQVKDLSNSPNSALASHSSTSEIVCESAYVTFGSRYNNFVLGRSTEFRYKMVNSCRNQNMAEKCKITEQEIRKLNDTTIDLGVFAIVSSSDGKTLYRNEICAACNGVTSIRRWDLRAINCGKSLTSLSNGFVSTMEMIEHCQVLSVPPADFDASRFECRIPVDPVSECDSSITQTDPIVSSLCTAGHYYPVFFRITYKNIFCYMCSRNNPLKVDVACKLDRSLFFNKLIYMLNTSALYQLELTSKKVHVCSKYQVFDIHLGYCRNLYCNRVFELPYYGRCVAQHFFTYGLRWMLLIKLTHSTFNTTVSLDDIDQDSTIILHEILRGLGIAQRCLTYKCSILEAVVPHMSETVEQLIAEIDIDLTDICTYGFLSEQTTSQIESYIDIPLGSDVQRFKMDLLIKMNNNAHNRNLCENYEGLNVLATSKRHVKLISSSTHSNYISVQTPVMRCPHIVLNNTEYCSLFMNNSYVFQTTLHSCDDINHTSFKKVIVIDSDDFMLKTRYYVCVDAYKGLFTNASTSTNVLRIAHLLLLLVLSKFV